jgi:hypothetical protein
LDTEGSIFGGFTPVEWEWEWELEWNSNSCWKADDNLRSFLFTLKNPHNIPVRRFALRSEKKYQAILCCSGWCITRQLHLQLR